LLFPVSWFLFPLFFFLPFFLNATTTTTTHTHSLLRQSLTGTQWPYPKNGGLQHGTHCKQGRSSVQQYFCVSSVHHHPKQKTLDRRFGKQCATQTRSPSGGKVADGAAVQKPTARLRQYVKYLLHMLVVLVV
jgi:hypothetical protein